MENKDPNRKKKSSIKQENEELRKKIQDEFGGMHWSNPDSNLPPELENEFLNHIMEFEKYFQNREITTVYEFLGKPTYKKLEDLKPEEISDELDKLYDLLYENQISLDTICEVSDEELYRFITKELFFEEKDDMRIPGMTSHYTYEEFHPNHAYDIQQHAEEFFKSYLNKNSEFYDTFLSSEAQKQDWHKSFRTTFSHFEIEKFEIVNFEYSLETEAGIVIFSCDTKATVDGSRDVFRIQGNGKMDFVFQWDFWSIDKLELPKPIRITDG